MIGQKGIPTRWGGVERHVEELSKVLVADGHQVLVYARKWYTGGKVSYLPPGILVVHTPTIHTKHLDTIIHTLTSTVHALFQKPDVIHYHGVGPALLSFIPRLFSPRTKVVVTFHCIDRYHKKWNWFSRFMLRLGEWAACTFPHETIAVSKTIREYCLNEYHKTTTYIPNGVNKKNVTDPQLIKQFGLTPNQYVVMVSRLVPHKGAHYLIRGWQKAKLLNPELLKNYKLAIVGASTFTDAYVNALKEISHDDVVFSGWQDGENLDALYAQAALQVHPSENEGMPLTVLEGMAHGQAVLVSDIGEHKELIDNQAELFTSADSTSLAHKLIALLSNPTLRSALGAANKQTVTRYFSWKNIGLETIEAYKKNTRLPNPVYSEI